MRNTPNWSLLALVALPLLAAFAWLAWSMAAGASPAQGVAASSADPGSGDPPPAGAASDPAPDAARTAIGVTAEGVLVHGRVLDPFGEPLGGALIGDAAADRPTRTAADGRFELTFEGGDRPLALLVLAAGHAPFLASQDIAAAARAYDAGDIQLVRGGGIRGRVTQVGGGPLGGAMVSLRFLPGGTWPAGLDVASLRAPAITDAHGEYAFTALVPGRHDLRASAPGMQAIVSPVIVREGAETVVDPIALAVGFELSGIVLDPEGAAVAGAAVRVRRDRPRQSTDVETAADGRFAVPALPPGPLRVEVARDGFLRFGRDDVDAARGEDLVVRLERGLRVAGVVVDARTARPVETFAVSIRRLGDLDPAADMGIERQLARALEAERTSARADSEQASKLTSEFEARLERVRRQAQARPVAMPADIGTATSHPHGAFAFDGLEEGRYAVAIASPEHQLAKVEPLEVRRGGGGAELRVTLVAGQVLSGQVVFRHDGAAVAGATVDLVRVADETGVAAVGETSLYPWVFAHSGPKGTVVMAARTGADGRFELRSLAPGRCLLEVRHPHAADHETDVFYLQGGDPRLRVEVGARASLFGRVTGVLPAVLPGRGGIEVVILGGHGTLRTAKVGAEGVYRFDDLQPGSYLVRACPADASQYLSRLLGSIFPLHAGAVDPAKIPRRDVTLAEGERRAFDVALDLPSTGEVHGALTLNGQPAGGCVATLRPIDAPGTGGLSLRATCDAAGRFALTAVPAGTFTLVLGGPSRQELHTAPLAVAPGETAMVEMALAAGGLRGRVVALDATPAKDLLGYLWVLPGAIAAPEDLYEYRKTKRTHRIHIRAGGFEDLALTPGPAIVVIDVRDCPRTAVATDIAPGAVRDLDVSVAGRRR